jgi:hypothetical protein
MNPDEKTMSWSGPGGMGYAYVLPDNSEALRKYERRKYIRQHAPTILAGLLADPDVEEVDGARAMAINLAGLIFDETEYTP